jgi:polyhydroxyalkanoate synthesis regulator protein
MRTINKYGNRRLYDTAASSYINLPEDGPVPKRVGQQFSAGLELRDEDRLS